MSYLHDTKVEHCKDALLYVVIPRYAVAIPVTATIQDTLASFLVSRGDYSLSADLSDYPQVSAKLLAIHFSDYEILPVLRTVEMVRPPASLTETERKRRTSRIREQGKREAREKRAADIASRTIHGLSLSL